MNETNKTNSKNIQTIIKLKKCGWTWVCPLNCLFHNNIIMESNKSKFIVFILSMYLCMLCTDNLKIFFST